MSQMRVLPDSENSPQLHAFHEQFPGFTDIAMQAVEDAERDAIADSSLPYRVANHCGDRAYDQAHYHLGTSLAKLGFRAEEKQCQMRHGHQSGYRVLVARGRHAGGGVFVVHPKGQLTRELIQENEDALGYGTLFSGIAGELVANPILNLWVFVEAHSQESVTAYLLLPTSMDDTGCIIQAREWDELGSASVGHDVPVEPTSEPDAQTTEFEIGLRNAVGQSA